MLSRLRHRRSLYSQIYEQKNQQSVQRRGQLVQKLRKQSTDLDATQVATGENLQTRQVFRLVENIFLGGKPSN